MKLARKRNLHLLSSKNDFEKAVKKTRSKSKKKPSDSFLVWKCKNCGRIFKNRYSNVKWHGSNCPFCSIGKEQRITHLYCEYIFDQKFEINKQLNEIFDKKVISEKLEHHNTHIDSFCSLKFKNREIKLAVEYNGLQHRNNKKGWKAFKFLTHNNGELNEWKELIARDQAKVNLFKKFNALDYFLIVVSRKIRRNDRMGYIIKEFKDQSGVTIEKEYIDWKKLYFRDYKN